MKWQARVAPSLGDGFAGTVESAWGVEPYTDRTEKCVFFGMYGLGDFQALWNHAYGLRAVLWAGSDIRNLLKGYWLDAKGEERIKVVFPLDVDHYVENSLEQIALASVGIDAKVVPSFLGDVSKYTPQELRTDKKRYYTSVSGNDLELYGIPELLRTAEKDPYTEYHIYGMQSGYFKAPSNVVHHGRVSQEQMDEETKTMTGAIRLTRFDGFSEILAKSILWGQAPISPYIYYPFLDDREALLKVLNKYPWNSNNQNV